MPIAKKRKKASTTRRGNKRIRVAIIGVGNCASSLVQGVHYYRNAKPGDRVPGIMHVDLGGYHIRDVDFVAAIDVDRNKVGKDLADAIYQAPNNTYRFADVPRTGVKVSRGMTHDGIGKYLSEIVKKAPGATDDIVGILRDREGTESKKISKTNAVTSMLDYPLDAKDVHVGPSDYVPWLLDRKWCYIRMEGTTFGDVPLNAEVKLEVWDSPNSAGVVIDAIRCCKLALDRGLGGTIVAPSAYFMKSPPRQIPDDRAREGVEEYIKGRSGQQTLSGAAS